MNFKLFRNHYLAGNAQRPVLLSPDGTGSGPFTHADRLPGCSDTAYNIVLRALAGEPRPNDPAILVEDGAADPFEYMRSWLGIRDEEIERAKLIVKILEPKKVKR
jgi:hypothetical protein